MNMANSSEQALEEARKSTDQNTTQQQQQQQQQQQAEEWETMARAWLSAFPEAMAVSVPEVETWIETNHASLPPGLKSMPRPELIERLLSIKSYMRLPTQSDQGNLSNDINIPSARFQRTGQWIPVYKWLESLNTDEAVKSKDISDWLTANPETREELCAKHSRYHLMHYIKKCHLKIIKRKDKQSGVQPSETALKARKDAAMKQLVLYQGDSLSNIPKDSDLYASKRKEALRRYEILLELEKKLAPMFSRPKSEDKKIRSREANF